jgi:hypothetical protein
LTAKRFNQEVMFHYTESVVGPSLFQKGFMCSGGGGGGGGGSNKENGTTFKTTGPISLGFGSRGYADSVIASWFGEDKIEEYKKGTPHKLDLVVVYGIAASALSPAPDGQSSDSFIVKRSTLESLSLPQADGHYFLRADHILAVFLIDPEEVVVDDDAVDDDDDDNLVVEKGLDNSPFLNALLEKEKSADVETQERITKTQKLLSRNSESIKKLQREAEFDKQAEQRRKTRASMIMMKNSKAKFLQTQSTFHVHQSSSSSSSGNNNSNNKKNSTSDGDHSNNMRFSSGDVEMTSTSLEQGFRGSGGVIGGSGFGSGGNNGSRSPRPRTVVATSATPPPPPPPPIRDTFDGYGDYGHRKNSTFEMEDVVKGGNASHSSSSSSSSSNRFSLSNKIYEI